MTNNDKPVWTKISFLQEVENLCEHGPSATVEVGLTGSLLPDAIKCLAMFDTGAAQSAISPRLVKRLGLVATDTGLIHELGREPIPAEFFDVRIYVHTFVFDIQIIGLSAMAAPHDVVVGRDILRDFRFMVDFTTGRSMLHFKQ